MPITSSAKKALRASLRKKRFNIVRKDNASKAIKSFKKLVALGDKKGAEALMPTVQKALDKAVKGNTLKKNTASRKKSRLSKLIKKLS
jgi:small subunit ribosomal protein S20